tara:strand:+ start:6713 stop:7069 length:357 start_codon:yes stop_codon:yes gene_type:complete
MLEVRSALPDAGRQLQRVHQPQFPACGVKPDAKGVQGRAGAGCGQASAVIAADVQEDDPESVLNFTRDLLAWRRTLRCDVPDDPTGPAQCLVCSHKERHHVPGELELAPFESIAWLLG